jgi:hypothetical protein
MAIKVKLVRSDEDLDAELTMLDTSLPRLDTVLRELDAVRRSMGRASRRSFFGGFEYQRSALSLRKADVEIRSDRPAPETPCRPMLRPGRITVGPGEVFVVGKPLGEER